jgi:hypothetical protein
MNLLRGRLTFANVMSVIAVVLAVVLALSGIGYAAFKLPRNSVGRSRSGTEPSARRS